MNHFSTDRLDLFYAKEDHCANPKEYFKSAFNLISKRRSFHSHTHIVDVGCACGDFLRYVNLNAPQLSISGVDKFPEMIAEASRRLPNANFYLADLNTDPDLFVCPVPDGGARIVTMLGVLSIFSSKNWIENLSAFIGSNGYGLIFGMINPYPYDVFISAADQDGTIHYGWNSWSLDTLSREFLKFGYKVNCVRWSTPIDIEYSSDNPLRSWTVKTAKGDNITVNGTRMVHDYAFLEILPQ